MKIADIIKYEGDNSTFVWKHPCEDFNSMTQLIVHDSQEAIFFLNGEALDLFGAGRHTLETQNTPRLSKILNKTTDGETPFHCEVYFINKTIQMAIKWGTDSKVKYLEPTFGIPIEIGAYGEMNLTVSDSRKLISKLVGTTNGIAWGNNGTGFTKSIQDSFRPLISTAVKTKLASAIKSENISLFEMDENLGKLSELLRLYIVPEFEEYGLTVPQFYITAISLPEDDQNFRRLRELQTISLQTRMIQADTLVKITQADADAEVTAAKRKNELERQLTATEIAKQEAERELIKAQVNAQTVKMTGMAEAEVMHAKGYDQKDLIQADVQKTYAENIANIHVSGSGGGSGIAGDLLGIGVGMAAAGAVAPQLGEMFKGIHSSVSAGTASAKCAKCGSALPANAKFCLECGENVSAFALEQVSCPTCGKNVAKGKFCPECGHQLAAVCPTCGKNVMPGTKFCPECGEKLL